MSLVDYLAIGHLARDVTPVGAVIGGTVAYSGATARALGCRTAILTSCVPDFTPEMDFAGVTVECVPAPETTTFENVYRDGSRTQFLHARARQLAPEHVPKAWLTSPVVHLAPIADELDPALAHVFPNSLIGMTIQGWLRKWDESGRVYPRFWDLAQEVMPLAAAVVLSDEDLADRSWLDRFRKWAPLLVLTQGAAGCTVYMGDDARHVPAPEVHEENPTGAGDVFAAAFFIRLFQTKGNAWEAARFANKIAAQSVTRRDLPAKIGQLQLIFEK